MPTFTAAVVLSKVTPVTAIGAASTVTSQVAVLPPASAVIVAVPSATAVTTPLATVTTDSLEDSHVTVLSVALSGKAAAINVSLEPATNVNLVSFNVIVSTAIVFGFTVTSHSATASPSVAVIVALIVAVPLATAITLPFSSTVATAVLLEVHVTAGSTASIFFSFKSPSPSRMQAVKKASAPHLL